MANMANALVAGIILLSTLCGCEREPKQIEILCPPDYIGHLLVFERPGGPSDIHRRDGTIRLDFRRTPILYINDLREIGGVVVLSPSVDGKGLPVCDPFDVDAKLTHLCFYDYGFTSTSHYRFSKFVLCPPSRLAELDDYARERDAMPISEWIANPSVLKLPPPTSGAE